MPADQQPAARRRPRHPGRQARNAIVTRLLRSPLHRLASGRLIIITVTGRKSGTTYSIPVGYVQDSDALLVASASAWWRNLRPRVPIAILYLGKPRLMTAEVITDEQHCAELYATILARNPINGRFTGIRTAPDGGPDKNDLRARLAAGFAVVRLSFLASGQTAGK
jgi:hypothetical protein